MRIANRLFGPFASGNHAGGRLVTEHLKADPEWALALLLALRVNELKMASRGENTLKTMLTASSLPFIIKRDLKRKMEG